MLPRTIARLFAFALVVSFGVGGPLPVSPAQAYADLPPFELRFPQEADKTTFHNDWGDRRRGHRHRGNDLMAAAKMTEVYAVADGVVTRINERSRPGRYISIEHADGWESLYIHLNDDNIDSDDGEADWSLTLAPGIEEGAEVIAGQVIGWAGDSGNAEGSTPHTHFELSQDGQEVNPYQALEMAYARDLRQIIFKQWMIQKSSDLYGIA